MSIVFLLMKIPMLLRRLGRRSGRRRAKCAGSRRSLELRASGAVGSRWQPVFGYQIVWNRSTRRAGARGGARVGRPRWARILTITGGSSMAALRRGSGQAMRFKLPPQFGQCSMSMSKTRLSSLAQLRRAGAPCA